MIAVWLRGRKGKGRKKNYALTWEIPVLDENGEPVRRPNGRVKMKVAQESCRTSDRKAAEASRRKKHRELNGLEVATGMEKHVTLDELANLDEGWQRNRGRAEGTLYLARLAITHLKESLKEQGKKPNAGAVTPQDVEALIAHRRAQAKAKAINNDLSALRATYNRAVKHEVLQNNPFAAIEKLAVDPRPIQPLTTEEEQKLKAACGDDLELDVFVRLALDTGGRAGELSNLRVADLDVDNCLGKIECNTQWKSKTRRNRPIAYTPETAARLHLWLLQRGVKPHVFREANEKPRAHYHRIAARFKAAVTRAGIKRKVTPQNCRQSVASLLAERGVNQRVAMEVLGHANIHTTAKYYQHVRAETVKGVILNLRPTGSEG